MTPKNKVKQYRPLSSYLSSNQPVLRPLESYLPTPTIGQPPQAPKVEGTLGTIVSTLSPVIDFLSRGQYASAKFFDSMMDESKSIFDATADALYEGIHAKDKLSYSDIIKKRAPEFAKNNPIATSIVGFIGDVALDPTTYLGIGIAKNGIKIGGKVLTKFGKEALESGVGKVSKTVFVGKDGTLDLVQKLGKSVYNVAQGTPPTNFGVKVTRPSPIINDIRQLNKDGYFADVQRKAVEVTDFYRSLGKNVPPQLAESIGASETIKDLQRAGRKGLQPDLYTNEVRERVETRIQKLSSIDTTIGDKLLTEPKKGIYLKVGIPFGQQTDLLKVLGLENISDSVKTISSYMKQVPVVSGVTKAIERGFELAGIAFNKNYGLPEEYIKLRTELENTLDYSSESIIRQTRKLFKNVPQDRKEVIGETMWKIDDETRLADASAQAANYSLLQSSYDTIVLNNLRKARLTPDEHAIVASLYQDYKDIGLLEKRVGLLKAQLANYSPRGYIVTSNPEDMSFITRGKYGLTVPSTFLASSQQRKFVSKLEAEAEGLVPEMDAAVLYAQRMLTSQRAVAVKQFKDSTEELFGTFDFQPKYAHTGILPTARIAPAGLPQRVIQDMKMLGEAVYPSGWSENTKSFLRSLDYVQRKFKQFATVAKVTFPIRQASSNTLQAAMISGIKAFKAFDPRAAIDASLLLVDRKTNPTQVPDFLNNLISTFFKGNEGTDAILAQRTVLSRITGEERLIDYTQNFKLRDVFGHEYNGEELVQLAREKGIIKGYDSTGESFARKFKKELSYNETSYKEVLSELGKFWTYSSHAEDYSRMVLFLNGMRMGHGADESAKLVNKALFDYSRGLSSFEKNVMRRIVPFYSFQRFALPFVTESVLRQPGTPLAMEKTFDTFNKLFVTGESLTPSEQEALVGNAILEQSHVLKGFDKDGKATFNVFNNMSPLDVLNIFVEDKNGNIDIERTIQKSVLATLSPYIKIPLEQLTQTNFFTGRTMADAGAIGNLSGIGNVLPEFVKKALSWEDRTNMYSGKTNTYINPFLAYTTMNFFPAMREYITPLTELETPVEGAMNQALQYFVKVVNPTRQVKIDIKQQKQLYDLGFVHDINNTVKEMRQSLTKGSMLEFDRRKADLNNLITAFRENQAKRNDFEVRGQGLGVVKDTATFSETQQQTDIQQPR